MRSWVLAYVQPAGMGLLLDTNKSLSNFACANLQSFHDLRDRYCTYGGIHTYGLKTRLFFHDFLCAITKNVGSFHDRPLVTGHRGLAWLGSQDIWALLG